MKAGLSPRVILSMIAASLVAISLPSHAIVGGEKAGNGEYSSAVQVVMSSPKSANFCSGFMVADRWVVTNARCLYITAKRLFKPKHIEVFVGYADLENAEGYFSDKPSNKPKTSTTVEKVIVHPQYDVKSPLANEIALLKLKEKPASPFDVLTLPGNYIDQALTDRGDWATAVGYGATNTGGNNFPGLRKKVDLRMLDNESCRKKFRPAFRQSIYDPAGDEKTLCAARLNKVAKGTCFGDEGGPLIAEYHGEKYVLGALSWMTQGPDNKNWTNCKSKNEASVYVRTSKYKSWIFDVIKNN